MSCKKNNTGNGNSGYCNSGNGNSGNKNSGDWNSGNGNSGKGNSGYWNSGDGNSGNGNSGYRNSGDWNSGDWNSGDGNSGNGNSGKGNSGDWNSGWFNTDEPNARFFNKSTSIKISDFYESEDCPLWMNFDLCVWVKEDIMTDEEKENNPTYKTTGGYLKTLEYKEAWSVFWRKTSEENRQKFLNLPNFDAEIFKEITGIDVEKKEEEREYLYKGKKPVSKEMIDKALEEYFKE